MIWEETEIEGLFVVTPVKKEDDRGFFVRDFCSAELENKGKSINWVQINSSKSLHPRTLRGLHLQLGAWAETKFVRCVAGKIFDVVVDLRPESSSMGKHFCRVLDSDNRTSVLVPPGCAHGFMTFDTVAEVNYLVSSPYAPHAERCLIWSDPEIGIEWPSAPELISDRDSRGASFAEIMREVKLG